MTRKRFTRRQILEHWEASDGYCWRCEQKIIHEVYGEGWELGHCDKPHWMGGVEVAPEHVKCNREDGKVQTTVAAKSVRIRARNAGIKKLGRPVPGSKRSPWKKKLDGTVERRT